LSFVIEGAHEWIHGPDPYIIASVIAVKIILKASGKLLEYVDNSQAQVLEQKMTEALMAYVPRRYGEELKAKFVEKRLDAFNEALSKECKREQERIEKNYVLSKSSLSFRKKREYSEMRIIKNYVLSKSSLSFQKKRENSEIARIESERKKSNNW